MHNIEYYSYDEKVDRKKVQKKLDEYVAHEDWQEGCTGLYRDIRWLDKESICEDREAAVKRIEALDRGDYDCLAVRYYMIETPDNQRMRDLNQKVVNARLAIEESEESVYVYKLSSEFVTCRNCGSKIRRTMIESNHCPVCGGDLRPDYLLKKEEALKEKYTKAVNAASAYRRTGKKRAVWLVKIEFHT